MKNRCLLLLLIMSLTVGTAHADIASVEYVDENKLTAGDNVAIENGTISVPVCNNDATEGITCSDNTNMPASTAMVMRAFDKVLPNEFFSDGPDDFEYWESEMGYHGGNIYYKVEELIKSVDGLGAELADKQPRVNGSEYCYENEDGIQICEEEGDFVTNAIVTADKDGEVRAVEISDSGTGQFITGVTVADNGAVTLTRGDAPKQTVDSALSTTSMNPVQNRVVNAALGGKEDVANRVSQKPASYTTMDQLGKNSYDTQHYASLKYVDSKVDSAVSTIDLSMAELNAKVGQNTANIGTLNKRLGGAEDAIDTKQDKLTAGAGIKIETNQTTQATTISAELGLIPAGTDKSQTATIWIE